MEMPGDSLSPLALALGLAVLFAGALLQAWTVCVIGGLICVSALLVWFWPKRPAREDAIHG